MIEDFTDEQARAALPCKWGSTPEGVLPAWVAEMDYRPAEPIIAALRRAVDLGMTGYPALGVTADLGRAYAGFARRWFGHEVDPAHVLPVVDVTAGMRFVLDVVAPPGKVILPVPAYPPQLQLPEIVGRERIDLVIEPGGPALIDPDALAGAFGAGGRVLLLTQPHNPWGRVFSRAELEQVRDVVARHDGFVISDEIHAPLVLPGSVHTPYLSLPGTHDRAVAAVAASKAFNVAGLKCAQLVVPHAGLRQRLLDAPMARNDSWSVLGVVAAIAAYDEGDAWLAALIERLDRQRTLLADLLAEQLPLARMRPLEATYLVWLDLTAYGHDDPAARILEHGVQVSPGDDYWPGSTGHVRLNIATSPERLGRIVAAMARALS